MAREVAATIPGANFTMVPGGWADDPAGLAARINDFLAKDTPASAPERRLQQGPFATILFTDLVRNTELLARLGDHAWRSLLREHERITRDLLKQHGGDEIKTIGDAFMASFGSATGALECAIDLQRAFAARNVDAEHALDVRIGVNAGEPIAEDGDLFGTAVTTASRIAGMAAGGEILASNVVRELVAGKGFLFSDRGDTTLRGFEDPVRLYEVRWQEQR
jgi:adenylate cyclase